MRLRLRGRVRVRVSSSHPSSRAVEGSRAAAEVAKRCPTIRVSCSRPSTWLGVRVRVGVGVGVRVGVMVRARVRVRVRGEVS